MMPKPSSFALVAAPFALALVLAPQRARATDLVPDGAPGADPNGPPPVPPPMPDPGTVGSPTAPPPQGSTAAQLQQASDQDTGVGLHLAYVQPELGFGAVNLGSGTTGTDVGTATGPVFGVGAGAEFITFQVGGRLRTIVTPQFNLWTVGGEFYYQPGSGKFWPRIGLAVGYAWANKWNKDYCGGACDLVDINGIDVGLRGGVQYFLSPTIEIGADAGLDALFLKRHAVNGPNAAFASDASGTGFAAVVLAHLGFHFP